MSTIKVNAVEHLDGESPVEFAGGATVGGVGVTEA